MSIRPTRSEAIAGRLSILRQQRMVFLAWLPYSQGCLQVLVSFECSKLQLTRGWPVRVRRPLHAPHDCQRTVIAVLMPRRKMAPFSRPPKLAARPRVQ